jgi:hypothetical protein
LLKRFQLLLQLFLLGHEFLVLAAHLPHLLLQGGVLLLQESSSESDLPNDLKKQMVIKKVEVLVN